MGSAESLGHVEWIEQVDSTNSELVRRERIAAQPHLTVLATLDQRGGRGRLGRTWSAAPGTALAASILIRPEAIPPERLGALTLLGGLAAREAIAAELPGRTVSLKWPNDVLVEGRKIAGVLAEVEPNGGVVLGIGINTALSPDELPVPTATSIRIESGQNAMPGPLLAALLAAIVGRLERLEASRGDLVGSGIHAELAAVCGTIGARVRAELPGGEVLVGTALGIAPDGAIEILADDSDRPTAIHAGDVTHLRYQ